jgi:4-hydroxy-tetrahydrodipicolinate synthase
MAQELLSGVFTALATPFTEDGSEIDWPAYEALIQGQIAGGVAGLVPCGTTGESPTLSDTEQRELVRRSVRLARGQAKILVGTGSNSTKKSLEAALAAREAGAEAVMIVMPYYNKPSQEGLFQHVSQIARAVDAPIVLYNIPGRTAVDLAVDTTLRILDACPNVVGIKDASGNVLYCQELVLRAKDRVAVLCGDDPLTLPMLSVGATGVISVTSNLYPAAVSAVVAAAAAGQYAEARQKHLALFPVHRALFAEPSPAPLKAALELKGRMRASVRLPIVEASAACRARLAEVMRAFEAS